MDLKRFLKHINRYKWYIILIPCIAVGVVYYLVKDMPRQYVSEALLSTGIVDQSKQVAGEAELDYFKTNEQFANIIEKIKLKKVMSLLSYSLIIHDLSDQKPFKKLSKRLDSLSPEKKTGLLLQLKEKFAARDILSLADSQRVMLYQVVSSMGYDPESLNKNLNVSHADASDFITVSYKSENPELSAFVVNTLALEFIDTYTRDVDINQDASISTLDSILNNKKALFDAKTAALSDFKLKNGVLNLPAESATAYAQITRDEELIATITTRIDATKGAIASLDSRINGKDASGGSSTDNREIIDLDNKISDANAKFIESNFNVIYQKRVDSLNAIRRTKTTRINDNNVVDPVASKQTLIAQKSAAVTTLATDQSSLASINKDLEGLRAKYGKLVPFDANIASYELNAQLAQKEYETALNQYNSTRTAQNIGNKISISQKGLIGTPEPSKKLIMVIGSGFGSFALCFMAIVVLYFVDNKITTSKQLSHITHMPVIGNLSYVNIGTNSIKSIWDNTETENYVAFKNLLRALRLEVTMHMDADDSKILGITSLASGEGKSLIASGLAHAFAMTGKKVLLVGGENRSVVSTVPKKRETEENFETFLIKREIHTEELITVLHKNDHGVSLMEMQNSKNIKAGFEVLKNDFDLIIIDVNSLNELNIAKEWLMFTEKNLAVFEAGRELSDKEKEYVAYLKNLPGFIGWVMNKIKIN